MKLLELLIRAGVYRERSKWNLAVHYVQEHWPRVRYFTDEHANELRKAVNPDAPHE
jgi:hypothetical protein